MYDVADLELMSIISGLERDGYTLFSYKGKIIEVQENSDGDIDWSVFNSPIEIADFTLVNEGLVDDTCLLDGGIFEDTNYKDVVVDIIKSIDNDEF